MMGRDENRPAPNNS